MSLKQFRTPFFVRVFLLSYSGGMPAKVDSVILKYLAVSLILPIFCLTSCKDEEDTSWSYLPSETVYSISGVAVYNDQLLEGVTVSVGGDEVVTGSDGRFEFMFPARGSYLLSFSKEGYVPVTAEVTIRAGAQNYSATVIKQFLSRKNEPITIEPDRDQIVELDEMSLFFPSGSVDKRGRVSITPLIPGLRKIKSGSGYFVLASIDIDSDEVMLKKPVEITYNGFAGCGVNFGTLVHLTSENGVTAVLGNVPVDKESDTYKTTLTTFTNHILAASINTINVDIPKERFDSVQIDNLDRMSAIEKTVSFKSKSGWEVASNIQDSLRVACPDLKEENYSKLTNLITSTLNYQSGSYPGISEMTLTRNFTISGDILLKLGINALAERRYSVISLNNNRATYIIVATDHYYGTDFNYTIEPGATYNGHGGRFSTY